MRYETGYQRTHARPNACNAHTDGTTISQLRQIAIGPTHATLTWNKPAGTSDPLTYEVQYMPMKSRDDDVLCDKGRGFNWSTRTIAQPTISLSDLPFPFYTYKVTVTAGNNPDLTASGSFNTSAGFNYL